MTHPTTDTSKPTPRQPATLYLMALLGYAAAVTCVVFTSVALPVVSEAAVGLAYPVVFVVAAASITLIFRRFVKR